MAGKVIFWVLLSVCLASAVLADNASNTTPTNFSSTICDGVCLNSSIDWANVFACESGVPGAMYACCYNKTLCEIRFNSTCNNLAHLIPQVIPPDDGDDDDDDNPVNPQAVATFSNNFVPDGGNSRVMRLFVNGDTAGEPIIVYANNVFGPMKGVLLKFFKDRSIVKTVTTVGETKVVIDEPGAYEIEATRQGYLPARVRLYLYEKDSSMPALEPEPVELEPVVEEEPEEPAEYSPITSLTTVTPKKSLNVPKALLLLLAVAGITIFAVHKFRKPRKPVESDKPNFGF